MENKKSYIVGGTTGIVMPIIYYVFNLQELSLIMVLGIGLLVGLIIGLLIKGVSRLMSN